MNKTSSARLHRDAISFDSLTDVFSGKHETARSSRKLYLQNGKSGPAITTRKPGLWQRYNAKLVSIKGTVKLNLLNSLYMSAHDKAERDGPITGKAKVLLSLLANEIDYLKMQGGSLRTSDTRNLAKILTELKAARHDAAAQARQEAAPPTVDVARGGRETALRGARTAPQPSHRTERRGLSTLEGVMPKVLRNTRLKCDESANAPSSAASVRLPRGR